MTAGEKPLSEELTELDPETRNLEQLVHRARELERELEELRRPKETVAPLERPDDAPTRLGARDRAVEVIEDTLTRWEESGYVPNSDYLGDALAEAVPPILAPDLPEPIWRPHAAHAHRYHVWEVPVVGQVEVGTRRRSLVSIWDGDEVATFTRTQARQVGLALVAAAEYPAER